MGSVHPRGVSTPTGSSRDRACRAGSLRTAALLALSLPFRGPSQHPRTVPSGPEGPNRGRCFLPWAFVPHDTCRNGGPVRARGFRPHAVPRPGFGYPPRGVHHRPCGALRRRASAGFSLQGLLLAPIGPPLGGHGPLGVHRGLPRSPCGGRRRGRLQGFDPGANAFRPSSPCGPDASLPSWACSLQSVLPPSPCGRFDVAHAPPSRVGRCDVQSRLRLEVLRITEVGWAPLGASGSLGLLHLPTVTAPRGSCGGRAHGFASRFARVALARTDPSPLAATRPGR